MSHVLAVQAAALREAADLVEAHPELPQPYVTATSRGAIVHWFLEDAAAPFSTALEIYRAFPGKWTRRRFDGSQHQRQRRGDVELLIVLPPARGPVDSRTPTEWSALLGWHILDPDGWRGAELKPWTEPLTRVEFERRAALSTARHDPALATSGAA